MAQGRGFGRVAGFGVEHLPRPLFIFPLKMGIAGAELTTSLSNYIALGIAQGRWPVFRYLIYGRKDVRGEMRNRLSGDFGFVKLSHALNFAGNALRGCADAFNHTLELRGVDVGKHSRYAKDVLDLPVRLKNRRGHRTEPHAVLALFHAVALLPYFLAGPVQRLGRRRRMGRIAGKAQLFYNLTVGARRLKGQQNLAGGVAVKWRAGAKVRHHLEAAPYLRAVEQYAVRPV